MIRRCVLLNLLLPLTLRLLSVRLRVGLSILPAQFPQKRLALCAQPFLKLGRAVAVAARPRLGAIFVPAITPRMSVFDAEQIEILLPVRAFFGQRRIAETAFNPGGEAVLV